MKPVLKSLTLGLGILSCAVWAAPQVGDYVVIAGTLKQGTDSVAVETRIENAQENAATKKFLVRTTTSTTGQTPSIEEEWKDATDLLDRDTSISIAPLFCANTTGGVMEKVQTPAGTFDACKVAVNENGSTGFMWIGPVPNGVVKAELTQTGGMTYSGLLKEFGWK